MWVLNLIVLSGTRAAIQELRNKEDEIYPRMRAPGSGWRPALRSHPRRTSVHNPPPAAWTVVYFGGAFGRRYWCDAESCGARRENGDAAGI